MVKYGWGRFPGSLAMQKTSAWSLGQENLLEEEMATHSSILAWRMPRTEKPDGLESWTWLKQLSTHACAVSTELGEQVSQNFCESTAMPLS